MAPTLFGTSGDELKFIVMISYVAVWWAIALIAAIILYKLFKALFRLFRSIGSVFGETATSKLISLGLASLLFPTVIPGILLTGLASFLYTLVEKVPRTFALPAEVVSNADPARLGELTIRLFALLLSTWSQVFTSAFRVLWDLPIKDSILMLGAGAVFGLVFREVERIAEPGSLRRKELWLAHYFRSLAPRSRQNLAFVAILAIAGYLSIAAIAAIPALTESPMVGSELSADKLKQRLESLREESERGLKELATPPDPFTRLRQIQQAADSVDAPGAGETQRVVLSQRDKHSLANFLKSVTEARDARLKAHADLVHRLKKQNVDEANWVHDEYQANTMERKGRREAVRYYYDVVNYYRLTVRQRQAQSEWSAGEIERLDRDAAAFDSDVAAMVKSVAPAPGSEESVIGNLLIINTGLFTAPLRRPDSDRDEVVPARPELGSYLGPFKLVASWLLRTESLSLALIVGMIGFGLLGSASSSFIREKGENGGPDQPLVRDLSGVIIRGCSAAIVVFLAAKGGLAIFGSGAADPNPYVLLLTCLVAAVFSDAVWERAQEWFKRLGERRRERRRLTGGQTKRPPKASRSTTTAGDAGNA
jgi:hypothetical protein